MNDSEQKTVLTYQFFELKRWEKTKGFVIFQSL